MNKVALIIIYNHQYNKNIDVLEKIYKDRFSHIYHIVPFYNGEKPNVIPVYESSYYFQGYVSQAFKSFFKKEYVHYFFIGDDLLLNPKINETNYTEHLKLNADTCFIPEFIPLHECTKWWPRIPEAFFWNIRLKGVEAVDQIPNYKQALNKFNQFGLTIKDLRFNQIWKKPNSIREYNVRYILRYLKYKIRGEKYSLSYPIVGSYSDIFIVSGSVIKEFSHYCGVFAATNLFVEIAIPTALVLSAEEIVIESDLKLQGKALWTKEEHQELDQYESSIKNLFAKFPKNYLYIHPIKLSKWNTEL